MAPPNIVVFGETGVGKSALINLIVGKDVAASKSSAKGVTLESASYPAIIEGTTFTLHDTAGLDEWKGGGVSSRDAITGLYNLMHNLEDGVSLLIYCIRGPRIKENTVNNYRMFYEALCQRKVKIVAVILGLENENPMDSWWDENGSTFEEFGMWLDGHACVCGTKGKNGVSSKEYFESRLKVRQLVLDEHMSKPWKVDKADWLQRTVTMVWNIFSKGFKWEKSHKKALAAAYKLMEVDKKEAMKLVNRPM